LNELNDDDDNGLVTVVVLDDFLCRCFLCVDGLAWEQQVKLLRHDVLNSWWWCAPPCRATQRGNDAECICAHC